MATTPDKTAHITEKTPQYIQNLTFDKDFDISTIELLGHDSDNNVLRRIQVNSDGELIIDTTNLDARYLKLDCSNDPLTGNLEISKADPELRLTDTGDSEYTRLTRTDTSALAQRRNRVLLPTALLTDLQSFWSFDAGDAIDDHGDNDATVDGATPNSTGGPDSLGCYDFDGDDYIYVTDPGDGSLDVGTGDFTISAWVKATNTNSGDFLLIVHKRSGTPMYSIDVRDLTTDTARFLIRDAESNIVVANRGTGWIDGDWHHIVMVVDRTNDIGKVYKDGEQTGDDIDISAVTGSLDSTADFRIGRDASVDYFKGLMDEVGLWKRVLTDAEITVLYNSGSPSKYNFSGDVETNVWKSQDGGATDEKGINTFGDNASRTILDGKTLRFNIGGAEKAQIDGSGNFGVGTATPDSLFEVDGALGLAIETVTGDTTLDKTHSTLLVNASGNVTITLPTAASSYNNTDSIGRIYEIKKIDADADTVTIDGNGSETIDGAATAILTVQYESITIQSDGSNWHII